MRVTCGDVYLTDWMDLDTFVPAQLREIARVLGPQGVPTDPDTDPVRASTQGTLSDFHQFSLIFIGFL